MDDVLNRAGDTIKMIDHKLARPLIASGKFVCVEKGPTVALCLSCYDVGPETGKAYATLFAAAPDILRSLKAIVDAYSDGNIEASSARANIIVSSMMQDAVATIAKAKGISNDGPAAPAGEG